MENIVIFLRPLKGALPPFLLVVNMSLILLAHINESLAISMFYFQIAFSFFTWFFLWGKLKKNRVFLKANKALLLLLSIYIVNIFLVGNASVKTILYSILIFPCVAYLIFFNNTNRIVCHALIIMPLVFVLYRLFVLGIDPEEIFINSRNYIVFYLVLFSLPYYYNCGINRELPLILYPVITVLIALFIIGRGGIIMSFIILFGWLFEYSIDNKKSGRFLMLLLVLCLVYILSTVDFDMYDGMFSRFEEKSLDSEARTEGWNEYLRSLSNPINMVLGSKIKTLYYVSTYLDGSLHNSYLATHARMGLFCFFLFFVIVKTLLKLLKNKYFYLFFLFLAICIKGYVDLDFPGVNVGGDINILVLFILYLSLSTKRKKINEFS